MEDKTDIKETKNTTVNTEKKGIKHKSVIQPGDKQPAKSKKKLMIILAVIGILLIAGICVFGFYLYGTDVSPESAAEVQNTIEEASGEKIQNSYTLETQDREYKEITSMADFAEEKWDEGTLSYNGKKYRYNENLRTYLFMGVDNDAPAAPAENQLEGGQSDAMFLLVLDDKKQKISIIAINRNTMAPVDVYDTEGNFLVRMNLQICLQHGYGDGMKLSCVRATEAVQRLLGYVPISGYLALNMGGFPLINDAVGGVELTPLETITWRDAGITEGETITLTGDQAYEYMRYRNVDEFGSSDKRLERQKQYILAFIEKVINDRSLANKIISECSDYMVASIDLPKIVESATEMKFGSDNDIYSIEGETVMESEFEAFYPDEQGLIELILNVFYEEVS